MNIDLYHRAILKRLLAFDASISECLSSNCSHHQNVLDWYAQRLLSVLLSSAYACIPFSSKSSHHKLAGWSKRCSDLKRTSIFWYKVWCEAGCPPSGVLCQIRKKAKSRYKYETRRLKRKQQSIICQKLASSLSRKDYSHFWSTVKNLNSPKSRHRVPTIDSVSGEYNIANLMASNVEKILNTHSIKSCADLHSLYNSSLSSSQLQDVFVSNDDVVDAIECIAARKSDASGLSSEHLKLAAPVISDFVSALFTAILRHGYMPKCFRDCTLVPIPKSGKDASCSDNYRPIALASTLSKVLEYIILEKYSKFFVSNCLQFGFKGGSSTTTCTAVVKSVMAKYIHSGSHVYGCFLDAI